MLNRPPEDSCGGHLFTLLRGNVLYQIRDWIYQYGNLMTFRVFGNETTMVKTPGDSVKLMKTKERSPGTYRTFDKIFGTCLFNQRAANWAKIRKLHPFEVLGRDWIENRRAEVKTITRDFIEKSGVCDQVLPDFHDLIFRLNFEITNQMTFGKPATEQMIKDYIVQAYASQFELKTSIRPLKPNFFPCTQKMVFNHSSIRRRKTQERNHRRSNRYS